MSNGIRLLVARVASATVLLVATNASAQTLAARVAAAGSGEVRMIYATRSGACGDGKNVVGLGESLNVYPSMESYGSWSGVKCQPGPARVTLRKGANRIESVRVRIGGTWEAGSGAVTDLGTVPAPAAANYFLDLAERATGKSNRQTLLAAAVADSADINQRLLQLAQRKSADRDTRRRAAHFLGMLGDASYVQPLTALARDPDGEDGVGGAATFALARIGDGAGIPALIALAHGAPDTGVRARAVFWLGQSDDARARSEVRTIINDAKQPDGVRAKAVFALAHGNGATAEDFRFLRELFGRVDSEEIQNQILMAESQGEDPAGAKWLLDVARDERASSEARKRAIFWAGQGDASTADIVAVYDAARDEEVKEHVIFVLSQRDDKAATDKLLAIVNGTDDGELRKKALFWLAQKHDPKITSMIGDMVTNGRRRAP